jgi:hypothetical protein
MIFPRVQILELAGGTYKDIMMMIYSNKIK